MKTLFSNILPAFCKWYWPCLLQENPIYSLIQDHQVRTLILAVTSGIIKARSHNSIQQCFLGNKTLLIAVGFDSIISNHCRIPVPLYWAKRRLTLSVQTKAGWLVYLWALVYLTLFMCGWRIGTFAQSVCVEKFGTVFQDSWGFWFLVAVAVSVLQARLYSRLLLFQPQVAWFHRQCNG